MDQEVAAGMMAFAPAQFDAGGLLQNIYFSGDGYLYMGSDTQGTSRTQRDGTTHLYGQQCVTRLRGQGPQSAWHQIASVFAPQFDPAGAGNTVLIAVGNSGSNGGIMKSTDRMDTWAMLSNIPQYAGNTYHVPGGVSNNWQRSGRRYFAEDSSYLFTATMKQGIMRSADHGNTWPVICSMAGVAPGSSYYARAMFQDPALNTTVYAGFGDKGTGSFGGLWKCANAHATAPNFIQCSGLPTGCTVEDVVVADGWVYVALGFNGLWVAPTSNTNSWTQIGATGALDPTSWWSSVDVINDGSGNHWIAIGGAKPVKLAGDDTHRCIVKFVRNLTTGAISSTLQMTNLNSQLNVGVIQTVGGTRSWWNSGSGEALGGAGFVNPNIKWDPDPAHFGDLYCGASQGLYRWVNSLSQWQHCSNIIPQFLAHAIAAASWGSIYTCSDFGTIIDLAVGSENASSLNAVNPLGSAEAYAVAISEDETLIYTSSTATNQKYTTIAGDVYKATKALNPAWSAMGLATAVDSATSVAEGHKVAVGLCALNNSGGTKTLLAATPNTGLWYHNGTTWSIVSSAFCTGGTGNLVNFAHRPGSQYVYVFDQASGIWRSNNYGLAGSWVQVLAVTNSDGQCGTIAAHPTRLGEIWYTTGSGLFKITGAHTGTVGSGAIKTGPIATGVGSGQPGPCGISDTGYVYCCVKDTGSGSGLALSSDGSHWVDGDPTGSLAFINSRPENMAFIPHVGTTPPVCIISGTNVIDYGSPETIPTGLGTSGAFTERQQSQNFTGSNSTTTGSLVGAICNVNLPTTAQNTHQLAADFFDNVLGSQYRFGYSAQKVYYQGQSGSGHGHAGVYPTAFIDGAGRDITPIVMGGAQIWLCYQPNFTTFSPAEDANFVSSVQWWANNHPQGANGIRVVPYQEPQNASWGFASDGSDFAAGFAHYAPLIQAITDPLGHHVKIVYDAAGHSLTTAVDGGPAAEWLSAIIALGITPDEGIIDFYGSTWETLTSGGTTNLTPVEPLRTLCMTHGMAFGYGEIGRALGTASYTPSLFPQYIAYIQSSVLACPAAQRTAVMWYNGDVGLPNQNTLTAGSDMIGPLQNLWNALTGLGTISLWNNQAVPPTGGAATLANSSLFAEFESNDCSQVVTPIDSNWVLVADGRPGTTTGQCHVRIWAYLNAPAGLYGDASHLATFTYTNPSAVVKGKLYEETIPAGYTAVIDQTASNGALSGVASPAALSTGLVTSTYQGGLMRGVIGALGTAAFTGQTWAATAPAVGDGTANNSTNIFHCLRGTVPTGGVSSMATTDTYTGGGPMTSWAGAIVTVYAIPATTALSFVTTSLLNGQEGAAYSQTVVTAGGIAPRTVSLDTGSVPLPTGLSLAGSTGVVSGTPVTGTGGSYALAFKVTDNVGATKSQAITLVIDVPLTLAGGTLPVAQEQQAYSQDLSGGARGGIPPDTFSTGSLPTGLTLSSAGLLSGTPAIGTNGAVSITVTVTDSASHTASATFFLTINPAVPIIFNPPGGSTDPVTATLMDENLNVLAPINFTALTAQLFYNFVGAWAMTIPFDDDFWQLVKKFITVDPVTGVVTQNGLCTVEIDWQGLFSFGGKVEIPGYTFASNQQAGTGTTSGPVSAPGPLITLAGSDYLALIANRIAFPDPTKGWAGQTATGVKTYTGTLEDVIKNLVSDNVGPTAQAARRMALMDIVPTASRGGQVKYNVKFAQGVDLNLMDIIRTLIGTGGPMGLKITRNGQRLSFDTYVPTDRTGTAYFSPDIGNLTSISLSLSDPTATTVLAQAGAAPLFFFANDNPNPETDWSRIEVYSDQTGQTDPVQAQQAAVDVLVQGQPSPSLAMTATDIPLLTFGRDYFLGDLVSVEPRPGDVYSDIVSGVTLTADASQQPALSVIPTVGYASDPGSIDPSFAAQLLKRVRRLERRLNAQIG